MADLLANNLTGLRVIVLLQVAIGLPAEAFFRYRARVSGERLDRTQEGLASLFALRACLLARWAAVVMFIVNPNWLGWSSMSMPVHLRWLAAPIEIAATSAMLWVFFTLGRNLTDTVVVRNRARLIISGPYRYVRHPLYAAFAWMAIADPLLLDSWAVGILDLAILTILVLRTRIEEARLVERFGDSYREYCEHTPRFIPGLPGRRVSMRSERP